MITIAVCDDSEQDIAYVSQGLERYAAKKHVEFDVRTFLKPEALLYELSDGKIPQIFILDVSMPGMDGFTLAEKIREVTSSSILIFLTSHADMAIHGYKVNALRYLVKLNMEQYMEEAMDSAIKELALADKQSVLLHRYNDLFLIPYKELIYVTRVSRALKIATVFNGELTDSRGITEFFNVLNDNRFLFIDRGCFVNIDFIYQLVDYDLKLKNGEVLSVSRRMLQSVKQKVLEYWDA